MADKKKPDAKSIITIAVAIIGYLAILIGVLFGCGVFSKNMPEGNPEDNTVKITVTIEVNGGTGTYDNMTFVLDENNSYAFTDEEKAALKDALKKDGYELKGLSTTPDGEGGWTVTIPKDAESPVTLYAIWEKEPAPELAIFTHEGGVITGLTEYGKTLSTIVIPTTLDGEQITSIGSRAFKDNETITSVAIPDTVTDIRDGAFSGCKGLTSIKIPDGVTSITHEVFSQCSSLKSIVIPQSVTSIGIGAFHACALTDVYYKGTSQNWGNILIEEGNSKLTTATVYYYSVNPPETEGNFWHYVEGVPTVWEVNVFITYYNGDEVEYILYALGEGESGIEKRVLQGEPGEKFVGWFEENAEEEFDYSSVTKGNNYTLYAKWHDLIEIDGETFEITGFSGAPEWQYYFEDHYDSLDLGDLSLNTTDGDSIATETIKDQLTIVIENEEDFYGYVIGEYEVTITYGKYTKFNYTVIADYSAE